MPNFETSFYDLHGISITEDVDHGHCVGLSIDCGEGLGVIWLYVEDEDAAVTLSEQLSAVKQVQLVDYI